jgi:hypothetical protein
LILEKEETKNVIKDEFFHGIKCVNINGDIFMTLISFGHLTVFTSKLEVNLLLLFVIEDLSSIIYFVDNILLRAVVCFGFFTLVTTFLLRYIFLSRIIYSNSCSIHYYLVCYGLKSYIY